MFRSTCRFSNGNTMGIQWDYHSDEEDKKMKIYLPLIGIVVDNVNV